MELKDVSLANLDHTQLEKLQQTEGALNTANNDEIYILAFQKTK